jgi:hypothetical protein
MEEYTPARTCAHVPESDAKGPLGLPHDLMLGTRSSLKIFDDRKRKILVAGIGLKESPIRPRMRWKLEEASRWTSERA